MVTKAGRKVKQTVITNIQRYSLHDGPGLRTILFLKGCPLSCLWCSNPETRNNSPELIYSPSQCIACGSCADVCPEGAFQKQGSAVTLDKRACTDCGQCAEVCPTGAASMTGYAVTIEKAVESLEADIVFFRNSGGGVTISGGEPTVYPAFTCELIQRLKERSIHTAVETCGFAEWDVLWETVRYADLVLYDLKIIDPELHKLYTGVDNIIILDNAEKLAQMKEVIFRVPIIPGYTDTKKNLSEIARFVKKLRTGSEIHLLPYHSFGTGKYRGLGLEYILHGTKPPSEEDLKLYQSIFLKHSVKTKAYY